VVRRSCGSPQSLAAAWAHEAHCSSDFSAAVLSGYDKQLRQLQAREQLSGLAFVKLLPKMELLEPLFKACEKDSAARRTMLEIFTGDTPIYGLLKHPKVAAAALRDAAREFAGSRMPH